MNGSEACIETDEFTDGDGTVAVQRTVERVDRGVVVTLAVRSRRSEPVAFALVEEFPSELPVSDAGFQPGTEPAGGRADADGLRVEDTVAPDEALTVVYALQFFEPAPEADLGDPELVVEEDRPAVGETSSVRARGGSTTAAAAPPDAGREASPAVSTPGAGPTDPAGSAEVDPLSVETGRGSTGDGPGGTTREGDPSTPVEDGARVPAVPTAGAGAEGRRAATDGGGTTGVVDADGTAGPAADATDANATDADATDTDGHDADGNDAEASTADRADAVETAEQVDEAVETAERVRATTVPDEPTGVGPAVDTGAGPTDAKGDWSGAYDGGVASELVAELRDGSVSDRERAALRRELGVGHADAEDVRIERLESRMSEFAAYADALGEVIDEHGTAEAFVGRFEDRIEGLRGDLGAVESELSATREAVDGVEDRLEALGDRLDALEERTDADVEALRGTIERVDSDLAEVGSAVEDEADERAAAVESLRETVEERHDRHTEGIEGLDARLQAVESFREELASVFDELEGGSD